MELDPGEYFHNMLPMLVVVSQYMPLFLAFNRSNCVKLKKILVARFGRLNDKPVSSLGKSQHEH